jgi:hypothetical protein
MKNNNKIYTRGSPEYNKKNRKIIIKKHRRKVLKRGLLCLLKLLLVTVLVCWIYVMLKHRL